MAGDDERGGEDPLGPYRAKRDFGRTPEPPGGRAPGGGAGGGRFVVQEHHATALHWDLRLERDGVLASWAVPKGIPPDPRVDHLAVHTEDHPLSYLDFEGDIPAGEYGGGRMTVWDRGTYECAKWEDDEVIVTLAGQRVRGRHILFRTEGRNWMLHRMDPPEDPSRELLPEVLVPLPLTVAPLPPDAEAWSFEAAWGGQRIVVVSEGGRVRAVDETGEEVSGRYPELRALGRALGALTVALEGEVVVTGTDGRPDPEGPARRSRARSETALRRLAERTPAAFLAADLVWLEGHATTPLPYRQRRRLLEELELDGPAWRTAAAFPGDGEALLAAGREQGLPGVVARRLEGAYEPGALVFVAAGGG